MPTNSYRLGFEAKLYYGNAGTSAATLLDNVRTVTLNLTKGEADVTTRGADGWKLTVGTLKDASVEFEMIWNTSDAGFTAIKNSFFNNTLIALKILDGTSGSGLDADFVVTGFTRDEALEEALKVKVTAKPALSSRNPSWIAGTTVTVP
jgi:hypothetical protein